MSITIADILRDLNRQRAALLTGGAQAPGPGAPWSAQHITGNGTGGALAPDQTNAAGATAATGNGTGGAMAPDAAAAEDKLAKALKALKQNAVEHRFAALDSFGGKVLGFGQHRSDSDPGHTGRFAVVQRGGKLFHVYTDGHVSPVDQGAVASALGIHPKVADLVPIPPARTDRQPGAALAQQLAALSAGTGGAMALSMPGSDVPRGSDPLENLRRLLHARA